MIALGYGLGALWYDCAGCQSGGAHAALGNLEALVRPFPWPLYVGLGVRTWSDQGQSSGSACHTEFLIGLGPTTRLPLHVRFGIGPGSYRETYGDGVAKKSGGTAVDAQSGVDFRFTSRVAVTPTIRVGYGNYGPLQVASIEVGPRRMVLVAGIMLNVSISL